MGIAAGITGAAAASDQTDPRVAFGQRAVGNVFKAQFNRERDRLTRKRDQIGFQAQRAQEARPVTGLGATAGFTPRRPFQASPTLLTPEDRKTLARVEQPIVDRFFGVGGTGSGGGGQTASQPRSPGPFESRQRRQNLLSSARFGQTTFLG